MIQKISDAIRNIEFLAAGLGAVLAREIHQLGFEVIPLPKRRGIGAICNIWPVGHAA